MCEEEGLMQLRKSTMFVIAFMLILSQMGHGFETNVSMSMSDESRAGCTDLNAQCRYWATIGECGRNPKYMLKNCKRSCSRDLNTKCSDWARRGECARNPRYMLINCQFSCQCSSGGSTPPPRPRPRPNPRPIPRPTPGRRGVCK